MNPHPMRATTLSVTGIAEETGQKTRCLEPAPLHSLSSGLQVESSAETVCDLRQHVCSCVSSSEDEQRRGHRDSTNRVHTKRGEGQGGGRKEEGDREKGRRKPDNRTNPQMYF